MENIKILRTRQVCEKLAVGVTTLFENYMKREDFPKAIKLGGTNAWRESDINEWINQQFGETPKQEGRA